MELGTHLTPILEEVRARAADGSVLLVEGDTDLALFEGLLAGGGPSLVQAKGRPNALALAAHIPTELPLSGAVMVIVDADFDRATGLVHEFRDDVHLVFTDAHDIETMIISIEVIRRRVLTTILRCPYVDALRVWNRALNYQVEIGLLKFMGHSEGWGVNFSGVPISDLEDPDGNPNRGRLVQSVLPRIRADGHDIGPGEVMSLLQTYEWAAADWPQVVNGHDTCRSIAEYARRLLSRTVSQAHLEDALRVACQKHDFEGTEVSSGVRKWCALKGYPPFL